MTSFNHSHEVCCLWLIILFSHIFIFQYPQVMNVVKSCAPSARTQSFLPSPIYVHSNKAPAANAAPIELKTNAPMRLTPFVAVALADDPV